MQVKVKKLNPKAELPKYAHYNSDMCADIKAISVEYQADKDRFVYHTGLAFEIPTGFGMLILPRSSNTKTECYLPNSAGVIDSGYRGEVLVIYKLRTRREELFPDLDKESAIKEMENFAPYLDLNNAIAQAIILPYPVIDYIEAEELSETDRGTGGFGSTNNSK